MRILVVDHDGESMQRAVAQLGHLGFDATGTLLEDEAHTGLADHDLLVLSGGLDAGLKASLAAAFDGPCATPKGPRDLLQSVRDHILQNQPPRLMALAGSTRTGSYNQRLLGCAIDHARALGAEVTVADLKSYQIPLFDQDLEYNGSITPLLKNTIDWISRSTGDAPGLACYANQVVTLLSASPGRMGGLRGLAHVRDILSGIGCIVMPTTVAVGRAQEAFDEAGHLKRAGRLERAIEEMVSAVHRLYT
jgi:chromate reductase